MACFYGHSQLVHVLLLEGANKYVTDINSKEPGEEFSRFVQHEVVLEIQTLLGRRTDTLNIPVAPAEVTGAETLQAEICLKLRKQLTYIQHVHFFVPVHGLNVNLVTKFCMILNLCQYKTKEF